MTVLRRDRFYQKYPNLGLDNETVDDIQVFAEWYQTLPQVMKQDINSDSMYYDTLFISELMNSVIIDSKIMDVVLNDMKLLDDVKDSKESKDIITKHELKQTYNILKEREVPQYKFPLDENTEYNWKMFYNQMEEICKDYREEGLNL